MVEAPETLRHYTIVSGFFKTADYRMTYCFERLDHRTMSANGDFISEDLAEELANNKTLVKIFTKYSHHHGYSCFITIQAFFYPGEALRMCSKNAQLFVLFSSPRDGLAISSMVNYFKSL